MKDRKGMRWATGVILGSQTETAEVVSRWFFSLNSLIRMTQCRLEKMKIIATFPTWFHLSGYIRVESHLPPCPSEQRYKESWLESTLMKWDNPSRPSYIITWYKQYGVFSCGGFSCVTVATKVLSKYRLPMKSVGARNLFAASRCQWSHPVYKNTTSLPDQWTFFPAAILTWSGR